MRRRGPCDVGRWTSRVLGWGLLLCTVSVEAATYYVATTGNDAHTCVQARNPATPRRTITEGANCLSGGDTLLVRAGTYPATRIRQVQGSASAWITIQPYPGERPVIDAFVREFDNAGRGVEIRSSRYLIFEGFEVTSSDPNRIRAGNHAVDITNPSDRAFLQQYAEAGGGIHLNTAHHIIVRGNEVHHLGTGLISNQAFEDGSGQYFHENQWIGNYVHHLSGYGTYICGDRITIRGNRFYSTSLQGIRIGCANGKPSTNFTVENNRIHENFPYLWHRSSQRFISGGNGIVLCCTTPNNITIRNNVIHTWRGRGIWASGTNVLTANNTIFQTQTGPKLSDDGSSIVGTYTNDGILADYSSVRLINNILYQTGGIVIPSSVSGVVQTANLTTTNPLFVNPTATPPNFHLQPTSPAIDAGIALTEVPTDFEGTVRPQDGPDADTTPEYDIGAYEYRATTPLPGDLNGDGARNLIDVRWLIEMLVGSRVKTTAADLDRDGDVDLADCQALIKLIVTPP